MGVPICQTLFKIFLKIFSRPSCAVFFYARIMPSALLLYKRKSQATIRSRAIPNPPYKRISKNIFAKSMTNLIS
jgi:hypothetical protein